MNCPFCRKPIPDGEVPIDHMVRCQREESVKWDDFLAGKARPPQPVGHRSGCVCPDCVPAVKSTAAH